MPDQLFSHLPAELREDLLTPRSNLLNFIINPDQKPKYPKSIQHAKYALPLLENNQDLQFMWAQIEAADISPLDVFWTCENTLTEAQKYKTKKLSSEAINELEGEVRRAARNLKTLVEKTPYERALKLNEWSSREGYKIDIELSEFLEIIATSRMHEFVESENFSRALKKPGAKKAIRTELVFKLFNIFKDTSKAFSAKMIAAILSSLLGEILTIEEIKTILRRTITT